MAQDVPKMVHRRAKRPPRGPKRAPRGVPEGPERQNSLISFRYLKDLAFSPFQANRLRHPRNLGANGPVQYPMAAPPGGAAASASLGTSSQSALKEGESGRPNRQTFWVIPTIYARTEECLTRWRLPRGVLKPAPRLRRPHNLIGKQRSLGNQTRKPLQTSQLGRERARAIPPAAPPTICSELRGVWTTK